MAALIWSQSGLRAPPPVATMLRTGRSSITCPSSERWLAAMRSSKWRTNSPCSPLRLSGSGLALRYAARRCQSSHGQKFLQAVALCKPPLIVFQLTRTHGIEGKSVDSHPVKVRSVKATTFRIHLIDQGHRSQNRAGRDTGLSQSAQSRTQACDMMVQATDREGNPGG